MGEVVAKVLLTGGTGLVGSHLAERLLELGYQVRCLLRYPNRRRWLSDLPVEVAPGDVTVPNTLPHAIQGVDAVVHAAALTTARNPDDYYIANAQGTANLLQACIEASPQPKRFLYCSSQAAAGPAPPGRALTASHPPNPITDYGKSKLQGEREVAKVADAMETVIIRPTAVFGPRDTEIFLYVKTMAKWRIKPFFGSSKHILSLIYVKDLVEALICALQVPQPKLPKQPLFVADPQPRTWANVTAIIEQALGYKTLPVSMPAFLVTAVAALAEITSGRQPSTFNRQKAREMLAPSWWCDPQPTIESLGWNSITPLPEAIQATVQWYRQQQWIT
jgi:dihydroflavonol-4-reductase